MGAHANHVHLILAPPTAEALSAVMSAVHRRYAGHIHARLKRTGHFWQGRFGCVAMDESHLGAALRYVALNPVRAGLVKRASDWAWSSAQVHLGRVADDGLTLKAPVADRYPQFAELLASAEDEIATKRLRQAESVGRPLGAAAFLARLEAESGRVLAAGKRGPRVRVMES